MSPGPASRGRPPPSVWRFAARPMASYRSQSGQGRRACVCPSQTPRCCCCGLPRGSARRRSRLRMLTTTRLGAVRRAVVSVSHATTWRPAAPARAPGPQRQGWGRREAPESSPYRRQQHGALQCPSKGAGATTTKAGVGAKRQVGSVSPDNNMAPCRYPRQAPGPQQTDGWRRGGAPDSGTDCHIDAQVTGGPAANGLRQPTAGGDADGLDLVALTTAAQVRRPAIFFSDRPSATRNWPRRSSAWPRGVGTGVRPGDRIALLLNCPQFVYAYMGAARIARCRADEPDPRAGGRLHRRDSARVIFAVERTARWRWRCRALRVCRARDRCRRRSRRARWTSARWSSRTPPCSRSRRARRRSPACNHLGTTGGPRARCSPTRTSSPTPPPPPRPCR